MWATTGAAGESNIWRISPNASQEECGTGPHSEKLFDGGFTSIIDLLFCEDGKLYVAELDELSWFAVEVLGGGVGGSISAIDLATLEVEGWLPESRASQGLRSGRTGLFGQRQTP